MYDEEVDGVWKYDPSDPYNDIAGKVNINSLRVNAAVRDGEIRFDSDELKEMHTNFMKLFPRYAGGENFWGTTGDADLFFQQKTAIILNGSWFFTDYLNTMDNLEEDSGLSYAEGSHRYLELLTTYTRRRMMQAGRSDVDDVLYIPVSLGFGRNSAWLLRMNPLIHT